MKDTYNDGIVYFYKKKEILNNFKARQNVKDKTDLEYISKHFYKEETQRQQDIVFAGALDKKLSLKISIPYVNSIESDYIVIIEDYLYSIFQLSCLSTDLIPSK